MTEARAAQRARISVRGVVQGVGFRPFVYGLALEHGLNGWVLNTSEDVTIEVEGSPERIERFHHDLRTHAPPLARIEDSSISYHPPAGYRGFEIRPSIAEEGKYQLVSPDIATCPACLAELLDPGDRRYRYPFTNCTNCGPRFTIIEAMPYDRPATTMRRFRMCPQCRAEYDDPLDRRFHAQPNACPVCGPQLELVDRLGEAVAGADPLAGAARFLREGKILAIKGLGGFLLACDAGSDAAVATLRQRKKRSSKPFAVMVADIDEAGRHCDISPEEERLLCSHQAPIVLLRWKRESSVSREVARNLEYLGVMLPYTPLHHLLMRDSRRPLVMTSGNLSEEPIARDNDEALRRLSGIADYFLLHNRDIYSRYDDSVAMVECGTPQLIRRARSYAPSPIHLPFQAKQVLACGAEVKNSFCLTRDGYAFLSQHIGDMENVETLEHYVETISLYRKLFRIEPEIVAHDLHPDYLATKHARELGASGLTLLAVQHHHAHIASCMAENGIQSPVIGVAFDGAGMGSDGKVWGGEFLVGDYRSFDRAAHLEYLPLPGGDTAVRRPYRIAVGYVLALLGKAGLENLLATARGRAPGGENPPPFNRRLDELELEVIERQIERGINTPMTSSMGRLFDCVSALTGLRDEIDYEGQAAIELEMAAHALYPDAGVAAAPAYPYRIAHDGDTRTVQLSDLLAAIADDLGHGVPAGEISLRFHSTIAGMTDELCRLIAAETAIRQVALSGGVFQNRLLLRRTVDLLRRSGFEVFTHRHAPTNDGCVSLGQAVIAGFPG